MVGANRKVSSTAAPAAGGARAAPDIDVGKLTVRSPPLIASTTEICLFSSSIDPRGRPTVTAGSDHYFRAWCPCVYSHFSKSRKKNNFQVRIVIATGRFVGMAKWIIDVTWITYINNACETLKYVNYMCIIMLLSEFCDGNSRNAFLLI